MANHATCIQYDASLFGMGEDNCESERSWGLTAIAVVQALWGLTS